MRSTHSFASAYRVSRLSNATQVVGKYPYVLNAHGAMLPFWRGNYPFYSVLGAAQAESGLTIHHLDLGMDTGKLIHIEKCAVSTWDTYASLADKGARKNADRATV